MSTIVERLTVYTLDIQIPPKNVFEVCFSFSTSQGPDQLDSAVLFQNLMGQKNTKRSLVAFAFAED